MRRRFDRWPHATLTARVLSIHLQRSCVKPAKKQTEIPAHRCAFLYRWTCQISCFDTPEFLPGMWNDFGRRTETSRSGRRKSFSHPMHLWCWRFAGRARLSHCGETIFLCGALFTH